MKKQYWIPALIAAVIFVAAIGAGMYFIGKSQAEIPYYHETESIPEDEPADEVVEEENFKLEIRYLKEVIAPASDLVTTRYYYKDADTFESYKEINGFKIPLTTDKVVFTYEGTVSLGLDFSKIVFLVDERNKKITVDLPEIKVVANEIDFDSFVYYEVRNSIFTEQTMEVTTDLMAVLQEKAKNRVMNDQELLDSVRDNAESLIRGLLNSAEFSRDYKVDFKE